MFVLVCLKFVVLLFWLIFAYDRQLVYPASIDSFFPQWLNHSMVCCSLFLRITFSNIFQLNNLHLQLNRSLDH